MLGQIITSQELTNELILEIKLPNKVENPIVLLFGGYQGSGKTTAIELLKDDLSLVIISPDQIRQKLLNHGHAINDDFRRIVDETTLNLFKYVCNLDYSIAMDNNTTYIKMKNIKSILSSENHNQHRLISVYLEASTDELVKRLNSRTSIPGRYKGTVDELYASVKKHGEIDKSAYDLVLNTEYMTADEIVEKIVESI